MKLQIDTENKTIKLEQDINLKELINMLDKFFPDSSWEEFKLITNNQIINWSSPAIIYRDRPSWQYPWYVGTASNTDVSNTDVSTLNKNTYNVEYKG